MPRIVRQKGTTTQTTDPGSSLTAEADSASGTAIIPPFSPKINREQRKPVPRKGVITVRMCVTDKGKRKEVTQVVQGELIGDYLGVAYFQGEWNVYHLASGRRQGKNSRIDTKTGAMALAMAVVHLPWHLYPVVPITATQDELERRTTDTPERVKLKADYERILNSRKW